MRTLIYGLGLFVLLACGDGNTDFTSEQYLQRAKSYFVEGDDPSATIELKNALQLQGDDPEARWLLGEVYLETGEIFAAEKELLLAQDLGWNADDIVPALAQALLAQRKYQDVLDIEEEALATLSSSAMAEVLASQAFAHLLLGEVREATALANSALSKVAGLDGAVLVTAMISVQQGDNDKALALVERLLETSPESAQAWWLKGQIQLQQGNIEATREAYNQAVIHSDSAFTYLVDRALINIQLRNYDAAQLDADALMELADYHPDTNYVQGLLDVHRKQYREAINTLTLALPAAEQYPLVLYYLSVAHAVQGDEKKAAVLASDYVELVPNDTRGRKLLAILWLHLHKIAEVPELLQSVLDGNPEDVGALNIMANAYLLDDQADKALVLYGRIVQLVPGVSASQLKLGLLASEGDSDASKALVLQPDMPEQVQPDEIMAILNHLREEDYTSAISAAEAFRLRNLNSLTPYHILGRVYFMAGQQDAAVKTFEKALTRDPTDPISNLALAQLALAGGDAVASRRYGEESLKNNPSHMETMMQLASLDAAEGKQRAQRRTLEKAMGAHPTALAPRVALARTYVQAGEPAAAIKVLGPLDALQRQAPQVLELSALAHLALGEEMRAQANLLRLVEASAASPMHYLLLAKVLEGQGDQNAAKESLHKAVELDGEYLPALVGLARQAVREDDQQAFKSYLKTLVEVAPEDAKVLSLRAVAASAEGEAAQAVEFSGRAFTENPTLDTLLAKVAYLKTSGQTAAARKALYQWLGDNPADTPVRLSLAEQLQAEGENTSAVRQYKAVLKREPENILALNNVAWLLREEKPAEALIYITTASKVMPEQSDLLDTMAVIQHSNGDTAAAFATVQRALALAPDNPYALYHHAMLGAQLGHTADARKKLEVLLAQHGKEFPQHAEAQALLRRLSN